MAVTSAVVAIVSAVAGGAHSAYQAHATDVHQDQAKRDQETALNKQQDDMDAEKSQAQAEENAVANRNRQRAITATQASPNYGGTLKTSTLGVQNPLQYAQKSLLGS